MIQNINIARVSLITHGSLSALRTLDGVYIPRDCALASQDEQDIAGSRRRGSEREGGEGKKRTLGVCVFMLLKAQGPLSAHCGLRIATEDACVRRRQTRSLRWKNYLSLSPFPFVGPIMS